MQATKQGSAQQRRSVDALLAESLRSHLETQHDIFWTFVLNRDIVVARTPEVYRATESPATSLYFCPVAQCGG
jgi:hypothetical protein